MGLKRFEISWLIARLGGENEVASELGVTRQAVHSWAKEGSIAKRKALAMSEILGGLDPDMLHDPWVGTGRISKRMTDAEMIAVLAAHGVKLAGSGR